MLIAINRIKLSEGEYQHSCSGFTYERGLKIRADECIDLPNGRELADEYPDAIRVVSKKQVEEWGLTEINPDEQKMDKLNKVESAKAEAGETSVE